MPDAQEERVIILETVELDTDYTLAIFSEIFRDDEHGWKLVVIDAEIVDSYNG
jgi:hypothetical protein